MSEQGRTAGVPHSASERVTIKTDPVLQILAEAGEAGMTGPDIARRFTYPEDQAARMRLVNRTLVTLAFGRAKCRRPRYAPRVRRGDLEASKVYHNTPTYRWYITEAGLKFLQAGGQAEVSRLGSARERQIKERRKEHEKALEEAKELRGDRDSRIKDMRKLGLTLEEIGQEVGLTRERVRQIANDIDTRRKYPHLERKGNASS